MSYDLGELTSTAGSPNVSGPRPQPSRTEHCRPWVASWLRAARAVARRPRPPGAPLVFLVVFAYLCLFAGVLQRIGDEGTLLNGAARVAEGAVPYRDFADLANPLSFLWLGGWFALLGTHLAVARLLLVLTGAGTASLLFWLTARAYGVQAGVTAALLATVAGVPFWPGVSHHWDSNLSFLVVLWSLARWQSTANAGFALLSGIAAAITSGFMVNKGAVALAVALVMMGYDRRGRVREVLGVVGGFVTTIAAVVMVFVVLDAASDLFYVNIVFPFTRYEDTGRVPYAFYFRSVAWQTPLSILDRIVPAGIARIIASMLAAPLAAVVSAPLLAALLMVHRLALKRTGMAREQILLWAGGVALWLSEAHRWDLYHLLYGSPILLAAIVGETLSAKTRRSWRRTLVGALTAGTIALGVWQGVVGLAAQVPQETRRGEVRTYVRDYALEFLIENTKPGDPVFVYPYCPMYYFLAAVKNPTRYGILLYGYNTTDQFREAVADLERVQPRFVLWDTVVDGENWKRWYPAYVLPPEQDLIVEPYLVRHYRTIATASGFRIMQRADDPGKGN